MLHTVNKSPSEKTTLISCLRLAAENSDIILIEDAVYAAMTGTHTEFLIHSALARCRIYVLEPDMECRGLDKSRLIDGIRTVDYDGFVELSVRNSAVHSWL
ncbi:MAG: sulfurtransferase complex subunit TusB [Acidiferrobacterales bacterium]|nr:sulfurtransferase complex subunit TusB [Acidiferrobacterales bacterium]